MLNKKLIKLVILIMLICSCEKNQEEIDKLKEKFSCTINGEDFFPKSLGSPSFSPSYVTKQKEDYYAFSISIINNSKRYKEIRIDIGTGNIPLEEREYKIGNIKFDDLENSKHAKCYFERSGGSQVNLVDKSTYRTSDEITGEVTFIKIDTVTQNIQGIFQFDAINKFGEKISITNGKFNVNYPN